jgi:RNA polymerase primary sigma factor
MSDRTTVARPGWARSAGESALAIYLKEMKEIPLLSRAEEDSLARRAVSGVQLAREKLIQANLRFVVKVAKRYRTQGLPLEDLISEGNIGLMKAIEHFDPERGNHFISYAVWWIRQAILKAIGDKSRLIRLPLNKSNELLQIAKTRGDLRAERCMKSEPDMRARRLHSNRDNAAELLDISRTPLSLEAPLHLDDGFSVLGDFVEDKNFVPPEEVLIESSLHDDINVVLKFLSPRESEIVQCRFGLNGKRPMTLRQVSRRWKVSRERVRQIQNKAIKRLRHSFCSRLLRTYN